MGQVQNFQNSDQNGRRRPQGQTLRRVLATLVGLLSLVCLSSGQPSPAVKFDPDRAWKDLLWQCGNGPRMPGMPGHIKTRDQIVEELKKTCTNVKLQPFSHKWSKTGKPVEMWNIMGEQGYSTAKTKVVVFAHWDTRPSADQEPDPADRVKPILGANDGASGVAVLLELSRAIKDRHPDVGILFLFVDGEDLGPGIDEMFLGAIHFSKHLPVAKPQYGILLDMIGDKDLKVPVEPNSFEMARPLVTAFYGHAMKSGFGTTFPNEWGPTIMDDHLSFNDAGIPTMDLIDFNYDAWHTLRDTPEQCSAESLGKIGKMLESWFVKRPPYKYAAE